MPSNSTLPYTDSESATIVSQAHDDGALEGLRCPRDGAVLRVFFASFRPYQKGATPRGIVHHDWGDVTSVSVECPACGALRARMEISSRRTGGRGR